MIKEQNLVMSKQVIFFIFLKVIFLVLSLKIYFDNAKW